MRLRLWSVATVVREAGSQGGDGEGSPARQKSSDGEGNASMHGKYFEASDVHIFFLFFCNLQMFVYIAWIYQI